MKFSYNNGEERKGFSNQYFFDKEGKMNNQPYNYAQTARPTAYGVSNNNWNQRVRPVASVEEVKASPIDFDGSVFFFPDFGNKRIYTKFITVDGIPTINMYELKEMPTAAETNNNYITREEFENVIQQLKMMYSTPPTQPATGVAKEETNVSPLQF